MNYFSNVIKRSEKVERKTHSAKIRNVSKTLIGAGDTLVLLGMDFQRLEEGGARGGDEGERGRKRRGVKWR